jgi:hypothetical protein
MIRKRKELKNKRCRVCKKEFRPNTSLQKVCDYKCAIELVKKVKEAKILKENKAAEKKQRKKDKEAREKLKTIGQVEADAKRIFQKWVRFRDKDLPCISCNKTADSYDGGHYFKSELYSGLIFHEDNCNKQCVYCNQHLHGNESNYRIGLVKKIGEERVRWLEENKDRLRQYKYSKDELIEIKKKYLQKLKEL